MLIDRRLNGKNKSAVNRQRFIKRHKEQIRKSVAEAIGKRSIKDINKGEKVNIPSKDITEPIFAHGSGGQRENVHPGNKDFITGDTIPRPKTGAGSGSKASNTGEGVDDFIFELSREEFLNFFFEDLELPDLVKTELSKLENFKNVRAGYTSDGVPSNINVIRSLKNAYARRTTLRSPHRKELAKLQQEMEEEQKKPAQNLQRINELQDKISTLKYRIEKVPFIDTFDLRFNHRIKQPNPVTQAVMFCVMDISGSMNEKRKNIAKHFFALLYLFLTNTYEHIDVVFIRHHTTAKEVDEEEFFYSRETGGTVVSSALEMTYKIISDRYPSSHWNIYVAQASDGDNWQGDSRYCHDLIVSKILPCLQYFAYVEINAEEHQELWQEYETIKNESSKFELKSIYALTDIYSVFRELFKKRQS